MGQGERSTGIDIVGADTGALCTENHLVKTTCATWDTSLGCLQALEWLVLVTRLMTVSHSLLALRLCWEKSNRSSQ